MQQKNPNAIFVGRATVPAGFGSSPLSRLQRDRHRGRPYLIVFVKSIVFIFLLCSFSLGCIGPNEETKPGATTTVILIRHAERDNFFTITAQGHKRAQAIVDAVKGMDIMAIYSPDLERNLDTVTPLANHLGIDITLTPRISKSTVNKIVSEILTRHRGEVILLVGNGSGNLRLLHQRLGGTGEGPYTYGDLFIYTIPDQGPAKIKKSRYGS
jgi:hypothetical protein